MEEVKHTSRCPICNQPKNEDPRYPDAVCPICAKQATDEQGRPLMFYNTAVSGGFYAVVQGSNEVRNTHICYIQGIKCRADEAYMGGIVIVPFRKDHEK